jgi:hypothetical protein
VGLGGGSHGQLAKKFSGASPSSALLAPEKVYSLNT